MKTVLAAAALLMATCSIADDQMAADTSTKSNAAVLSFEPNMRLVHATGAIRVQNARITKSHTNQGSTFTPLAGDVLVVVEFASDVPGTPMESPAGAIGLEDHDGSSVITPLHAVTVGGIAGTAKSPSRHAVDTFILGADGSTTSAYRVWVLIWSVKSDALPVYLRVPGVSMRIKLPEA